MPVTLKFQSSGTIPGDARPVPMRGGSLTIGRGPTNDLVLPDPDRMLSKNHCVIEDHNGNVVVVDLSTNGTFLNYSKIPLGRTPTPLNNGDILCVGSYELVVERTDGAYTSAAIPFYAGWYVSADASATPDRLEMSLDRSDYAPGDTARLRIVPRMAGRALITVMSDRLIARKAVEVVPNGEEAVRRLH